MPINISLHLHRFIQRQDERQTIWTLKHLKSSEMAYNLVQNIVNLTCQGNATLNGTLNIAFDACNRTSNGTTEIASGAPWSISLQMRIFLICLYSMVFLLGVSGNALVCYIIGMYVSQIGYNLRYLFEKKTHSLIDGPVTFESTQKLEAATKLDIGLPFHFTVNIQTFSFFI